jgi:hypothetical protein
MSGSSSFSLFFYFDHPPHRDLSLSSLKLPLLSDGKKKKRRRIEEDFGSTDFDVLFVDGFGFLKIFFGLVWFDFSTG